MRPGVVVLTAAELKDLPEFSCSLPTGTTEGRRWKRNEAAYGRSPGGSPPEWWVGEYGAAADGVVPITWHIVRLKTPHMPGRFGRLMARFGLYQPPEFDFSGATP